MRGLTPNPLGYATEFIHSGYFYSASSKSTTTQRRFRLQHRYCFGVSTPKRYWQLHVKGLSNISTWWLELDSNFRPSGRKASYPPRPDYSPDILRIVKATSAADKQPAVFFLTIDFIANTHR